MYFLRFYTKQRVAGGAFCHPRLEGIILFHQGTTDESTELTGANHLSGDVEHYGPSTSTFTTKETRYNYQ